MFKVTGGAQNYAWGKIGLASWVSRFIDHPNDSACYAEFWLGTHPSLPSYLESGLVSEKTGELPFLFKVLSIAKPLSIQLHPNKAQAEMLHDTNPQFYPDNNYKPEMCIAKGQMKLFFGLRPMVEVEQIVSETPELFSIVGTGDIRSLLSNIYRNEDETRAAVQKYCERVGSGIYCEVNRSFPNDPGVFFAMFMNYVELTDGEAMVIDAGVPHCYIQGDCIEAMACSDNVVRAGLTPKPKDVRTLLDIMNYSCEKPVIFKGKHEESFIRYTSGYQEFQVLRFAGSGIWRLGTEGASLGLIDSGTIRHNDLELRAGESFLVDREIEVASNDGEIYVCCRG